MKKSINESGYMRSNKTVANPFVIVTGLLENRQLIWQLTKREIVGKYRGSVVGLFWSLLHPIFMLTIYTFVFSVIFKARWGIETGDKIAFAIVLFTGLIIHSLFSECLLRSPSLILSNISYVKKVVFPLEILPIVITGAAVFHALISIAVLLAFYLVGHGGMYPTTIFVPIIILPFIMVALGVSWFLSALAVFFRDIGQIVGIATTALLFLSPIFYPLSALPEWLRPYTLLNPLTFIIEETRSVMIYGRQPDWVGLGIYYIFGFIVAYLGFIWFQRTKKGFADVV